MKLHTGESLVNGTPEWTWEQRKLLGQQYLNDLAEAIIQYKNSLEERFYGHVIREIDTLIKQLELEGRCQ